MVLSNVTQFLNDYSVVGRDLEYSTEYGTHRGPISKVEKIPESRGYLRIIPEWEACKETGTDVWEYSPGMEMEDGSFVFCDDYDLETRVVDVGDTGFLAFASPGAHVSLIYPVGDNLSPSEVRNFPAV